MVSIIIPIYKSELTEFEKLSLEQCFKVLGKHKICFVAPESLNLDYYRNLFGEHFIVQYFNPKYFKGILGYNQLMLSKEFYERFLDNEYILIYQLDCYVFRDELDYWCSQGYDYIGAPWLEKSYYIKSKKEKLKFLIKRFFHKITKHNKLYSKDILIYDVGNGGFSLRNTKKCFEVINNTPQNILNKFMESDDPKSLYNEDIFWSFMAKGIRKPNYKTAAKFSLDLGADIGIKLNDGQLPFGCHAWYKKYHYWEKYIK